MPFTKGIIDWLLSKAISKKLLVFGVATVLLFLDKISGDEWLMISCIYISAQGVIDTILAYRK